MFFIVLAAAFVALAGYVCLAPEEFGFLRLPQVFLQLGPERTVTGLALMLLGFMVALAEMGGVKAARAGRARPLALGEEEPVPATGELRLDPEPARPPVAASGRMMRSEAPRPIAPIEQIDPADPSSAKRRPDLYAETEDALKPPPAVPKPDTPPPPFPSAQLEP